MIRREHGTYADRRNGHEVWSVWGTSTIVHDGQVIQCPSDMMFNRLSPNGQLVASKAHIGGELHVNGIPAGKQSPGTEGHIWVGEEIVLAPSGPNMPSTGFAFVGPGGPVLMDLVLGPRAPMGRPHLFKAIHVGDDIWVGQGDAGGLVVEIDGVERLLSPGSPDWLNFHREGDRVVGAANIAAHEVVLVDLSIADLRALPLYAKDTPIDPPDPPKEPPVPNPSLTDAAKATIYHIWETDLPLALAGLTTPKALAAATSDVLFKAAYYASLTDPSVGLGLYPKTAGTNHEGFGEDILLIKRGNEVFWRDAVVNISTPTPALNIEGEFAPSDEDHLWTAPPKPQDAPGDAPKPTPDPTPCRDCQALQKRLEALEVVFKEVDNAFEAKILAIENTLLDLLTRPAPEYVGEVVIGRSYGHSHGATVKITPR